MGAGSRFLHINSTLTPLIERERKVQEEFARRGKLFLVGDIDTEATERFLVHLELAKESDSENILVYITSLGGSLFEALAIYDAIRTCSKVTSTVAVGVCASAAAVVLQGGVVRAMSEKAWLMLHEPSTSVEGPTSMIETEASLMRRLRELIVGVLASGSKVGEEKIREAITSKETWLSASEALQWGLVDMLVGGSRVRRRKR